MLWSFRMVVLMGEMRSTKPTTTELPEDVRSSTLSPTTKGRDTNCSKGQPICLPCTKPHSHTHTHTHTRARKLLPLSTIGCMTPAHLLYVMPVLYLVSTQDVCDICVRMWLVSRNDQHICTPSSEM